MPGLRTGGGGARHRGVGTETPTHHQRTWRPRTSSACTSAPISSLYLAVCFCVRSAAPASAWICVVEGRSLAIERSISGGGAFPSKWTDLGQGGRHAVPSTHPAAWLARLGSCLSVCLWMVARWSSRNEGKTYRAVGMRSRRRREVLLCGSDTAKPYRVGCLPHPILVASQSIDRSPIPRPSPGRRARIWAARPPWRPTTSSCIPPPAAPLLPPRLRRLLLLVATRRSSRLRRWSSPSGPRRHPTMKPPRSRTTGAQRLEEKGKSQGPMQQQHQQQAQEQAQAHHHHPR